MTFAPPTLVELGRYIVAQGCVNLGVVGDTAHTAKGVSYHLGEDQLTATAYSRQTARDKAGLSNAASAIDIGKIDGTLANLQRFSVWMAGQCAARAIDTLDIREVIYSPDGIAVLRWDAETQKTYQGGTGTGHGDDSHRTHTHVSFYRDSEFRSKLALFKRYFEEEEVTITVVKGEDWTPSTTRRPYRAQPIRALPAVGYVELGQTVRTIAEATTPDGNRWRLTEIGGAPAWLLRTDFTPGTVPVDQGLTDYIARVPAADCAAQVLAGRQAEWDRIVPSVQAVLPPRP